MTITTPSKTEEQAAKNPMKSTICAIMRVYNREAPGSGGTLRGLTPEGLVPMPVKSTVLPTLTTEDIERFWQKVRKSDGCWEWTAGRSRNGYGLFWVSRSMFTAHRVVWTITHGEIPHGLYVCHHCDNRKCINPAHLFLGTHRDNMLDMLAKGRANLESKHVWGENHGQAKLTRRDVATIHTYLESGMNKREIGVLMGVSVDTIRAIASGKHWSNREVAA